jgi:phosphate transport system protein
VRTPVPVEGPTRAAVCSEVPPTEDQLAREGFHSQLGAVLGALVDMTGTAGEAIERATVALLDADLDAADEVATLNTRLDDARRVVEEQTYELLARQQPVAADLRALVSAIRIGIDIDRMGSLANHIAKVARRRHPAHAVPAELVPRFREMGIVARRVAESAGAVLAEPDAANAARLDVDDDTMDTLHRRLFRVVLGDWEHGVEAAIDVVLLGRYYERFADHAVAIAETVVYLVTGELPDERADHLG